MKKTEYYQGAPGEKYGIYNTIKKRFQFGICEDTPALAQARLFQKIGEDARKHRFQPKRLSVSDRLGLDHHKREQIPDPPMPYKPVCPRGYDDCVRDPAYIQYHYPDWYAELYGDLAPWQAILAEGGCLERAAEDPDEKFYCYDDEDK